MRNCNFNFLRWPWECQWPSHEEQIPYKNQKCNLLTSCVVLCKGSDNFHQIFLQVFHRIFVPVNHPCLLAVGKAVSFFVWVLICHEWVFFNVCLKFADGFFIQNYFMEIPFCICEAPILHLPVVARRVLMTMSWPAKTTQKSKMICVHFLDWVVQWFRHFSLDFFSSLQPYFRPGQSSWFTSCSGSDHFLWVGFNLPWMSFCQCFSKMFGLFFLYNFLYADPYLHW